jgi:hypothetical protein
MLHAVLIIALLLSLGAVALSILNLLVLGSLACEGDTRQAALDALDTQVRHLQNAVACLIVQQQLTALDDTSTERPWD